MKRYGWTSAGLFALMLAAGGCASDDPFADTGADGTEGDSTGGSATSTSASASQGDASASADGSGGTTGSADTGSMDTGSADDTGSNTTGPAECPPIPTRMIILGDSIFACANVGGKESETCSAKIVNQYISDNVGPLSYENEAVNGAVTHDIVSDQIPGLEVGMPGHTVVLIFIGGNDLQPYIFMSDEETEADYMEKRPELDQDWADIFAFLNDPANFPDGTTILMNTQYNPFDDCTAAPYNLSEFKIDLLNEYNADLVDKADSQDNAWIADQHDPFLGHGHHKDVMRCPYYMEGAEGWMFDLIHPNVAGHANIATVLNGVVDEVYAACE